MLPSIYELTDPKKDAVSAFSALNLPDLIPSAGVYNKGLLTVLDFENGKKILGRWVGKMSEGSIALATTGFGDVFFWNPSQGVMFLEVQYGKVEFVDAEVGWFLETFLDYPEVLEGVLRKTRLEHIVHLNRALKYGESFILKPWIMLGGNDLDERYVVGNTSVYIDLVAQMSTDLPAQIA